MLILQIPGIVVDVISAHDDVMLKIEFCGKPVLFIMTMRDFYLPNYLIIKGARACFLNINMIINVVSSK